METDILKKKLYEYLKDITYEKDQFVCKTEHTEMMYTHIYQMFPENFINEQKEYTKPHTYHILKYVRGDFPSNSEYEKFKNVIKKSPSLDKDIVAYRKVLNITSDYLRTGCVQDELFPEKSKYCNLSCSLREDFVLGFKHHSLETDNPILLERINEDYLEELATYNDLKERFKNDKFTADESDECNSIRNVITKIELNENVTDEKYNEDSKLIKKLMPRLKFLTEKNKAFGPPPLTYFEKIEKYYSDILIMKITIKAGTPFIYVPSIVLNKDKYINDYFKVPIHQNADPFTNFYMNISQYEILLPPDMTFRVTKKYKLNKFNYIDTILEN